ncbi:MAG: hypothetical protein U0176_08980 [Bacteroidia bacterium]
MKTQNFTFAPSQAAESAATVWGSFSPALPYDCVWALYDCDNSCLASGNVQEDERVLLSVAIPQGASTPVTLHVHHVNWDFVPNTMTECDGGLVIIDNLEVAIAPTDRGERENTPTFTA